MKRIFTLLLLVGIAIAGNTQNSKWTTSAAKERGFVKNLGQYDGQNWLTKHEVEYALRQPNGWTTYFTEKGITHRLESLIKNPRKKPGEKGVPSRIHKSELIDVFFVGTNANVQIIPQHQTDFHFSYGVRDIKTKEVRNISNVKAYQKLLYKNIYNNIDIEYTLHEKGGIKYNIILHPGANPADIKMKYITKHTNVLDENVSVQLTNNGQLKLHTSKTDLIEHAPVTFYAASKSPIQSKYKFKNNILSFDLGNYDKNRKVIIDPWIVTPVWDDGDFTREVETDAAGNVYAIGGETPMELRQYDSNGNFQWAYLTPWDTIGGDWLGTLATDFNGNSFITQGTNPEIERIDNTGNMVWHANNNGFSVEYWSITFNCDNSKLIVGGTKSTTPLFFPIDFYAMMYDIDPNNGSVLAEAYLDTSSITVGFPPPTPVEVRSITSSRNSRYIFLTHHDVGAQDQNFNACTSGGDPTFQVDNTEHLGYKCENYLSAAQNGGGLKALATGDNYFYTHKGDEILQWDINTGALLNTVPLPGGSANSSLFGLVVHCSGLDVDANGNVYAGSMDRVVKFDQNLNVISQSMTTGGFTVYDVDVNSNGEVIAGGAILNNSTSTGRGGRIEALAMTAGAQYSLTCCDANFCPVDTLCDNDPAVTLQQNVVGGTWSISPATPGFNATTGVFDPSLAGPGVYTVTYTMMCGFTSNQIVVINCSGPCDATITQAGPFCENDPPTNLTAAQGGGTWTGTGITNGTLGTFDPSVAGAGSHVITYTLPTCNDTVTLVVNPLPNSGGDSTVTFCPTDPSTDLFNYLSGTPDNGGAWTGPSVLANGDQGTFNPASNAAGVYTYTVTNSCGTSSNTVTVTISPNPDPGTNGTVQICGNASNINLIDSLGGTPSTGGIWSGPSALSGGDQGTFNPASNLAGVYTYTVIDCNSNPQTATVTVTIIPAPDAGTDSTVTFCPTDPATDLFNYLGGSPATSGSWSGPSALANGNLGTFNPASNVAGTYTYTVTNACGSATANVTVAISANPSPGTNGTATFCANDPAANLIDSLAGSPDPGGTWSGPSALTGGDQGTFNPATNAAGVYTYTVLDCNSNPQTATVTVTVNPAPNSGGDSTLTICPTDPATDLFNYLSGTPDNGGTWSGPSALTNGDQGTFNPASNVSGVYTYTVTNSCGSSSNTVTVTISANPSPGTNGTVTICSNAAPINLEDSLGGTPDPGGTWSPAMNSGTGVFDPSIDPSGVYTYTVLDCNSNPLTSTVTVTVVPGPDAGLDGSITLCATDPATDLFTQLGGTPSAGGSWSPAMNSGTGVFDPSIDAAGVYTYTVTNSCGSASSNVTVTVSPCTTPSAGYSVSDSTVCEGDCITITDQSSGATSYQWIFNGGTPASATTAGPHTVCFNSAGNYTIEQIVTNSNGSDTLTSTILVHPTPTVDAGPDVTIDLGQSVLLNAIGSNGTYSWTPPTWLDCITCTSPTSTPDETITYTVIVVDSNGCTASDQVTIFVDFDYVIWVPNIFSPNGDGNNDIAYVRGRGIQDLTFVIYDRWGEKVFETSDLNIGWDGSFRGKPMNNAVFVYYLEATFLDGTQTTKKGDITLIR